MPVTVPIKGTEINVAQFGQPVADAVNANEAAIAALKLSQTIIGTANQNVNAGQQLTVVSLTIPAASLPTGRKALVTFNVWGTQSTGSAIDTVFNVPGLAFDHQHGSGWTAAGTMLSMSYPLAGDGTSKALSIQVFPWGTQPCNVRYCSITALILPS